MALEMPAFAPTIGRIQKGCIPRMDRADISFWLSITSFATSSVLAVFKAFEFYSSRRAAFAADVRLTGSEEVGNEIVLLNKSSIPATISYFELEWTERQRVLGWPIPFTRKVIYTSSPIDPVDGYGVTVAPHEVHSLRFVEQDHFDWGFHLKQDIYLKLWLVGRGSPISIWVTGPYKFRGPWHSFFRRLAKMAP
jgi:hypothetical protein